MSTKDDETVLKCNYMYNFGKKVAILYITASNILSRKMRINIHN